MLYEKIHTLDTKLFQDVVTFSRDLVTRLDLLQVSLQNSKGDNSYVESVGKLSPKSLEDYGVEELKFSKLNSELFGSPLEALLTELTSVCGDVYRARLMLLNPGGGYSMHRDPSVRVHVPLYTVEDSKFMFITPKISKVYFPADGSVYLIDTRERHTYLSGSSPRLHFVACTSKLFSS